MEYVELRSFQVSLTFSETTSLKAKEGSAATEEFKKSHGFARTQMKMPANKLYISPNHLMTSNDSSLAA
jgi:hypothetical protein